MTGPVADLAPYVGGALVGLLWGHYDHVRRRHRRCDRAAIDTWTLVREEFFATLILMFMVYGGIALVIEIVRKL
jgi:hypothetical protein